MRVRRGGRRCEDVAGREEVGVFCYGNRRMSVGKYWTVDMRGVCLVSLRLELVL